MSLFNRRFKPTWLMTIITLLGVALFIGLGMWQLDRVAYKQTIVDKFEARLDADYRVFEVTDDWQSAEYSRVILRGRFDNQHTLLIDNQLSRGRAGYQVISPFELSDGNVILVNRGWVSAGKSREVLPKIGIPEVSTGIKGVVVMPAAEGFRMGEVLITGNWPLVIPFIDISALQASFDNRLLPVILWQTADQEGLYERDWQPVWMLPEKSLAYAVQWFSFAVIALLLFFILNLRKLDD